MELESEEAKMYRRLNHYLWPTATAPLHGVGDLHQWTKHQLPTHCYPSLMFHGPPLSLTLSPKKAGSYGKHYVGFYFLQICLTNSLLMKLCTIETAVLCFSAEGFLRTPKLAANLKCIVPPHTVSRNISSNLKRSHAQHCSL